MKTRHYLLVAVLIALPAVSAAQDFGVMESAETIDRGNFKLKVNPMFLLGDGDAETGLAGGVGYGFSPRLDGEVQLAGYDGIFFLGGNLEYWLMKGSPLDVSASAGFHYGNTAGVDQTGVDVTLIASHAATRQLDVYGALDFAFDRFRSRVPNRTFNQVYLVPGVEYKVHRDLDVLGEFGLALSNSGNNYVSVGVAYYVR